MMQAVPGGATARPFVTHHNALDLDLYLRIAPELYLKRLLVGGLHRVFEINRNFRNEGISTQHNPEFTMLEFYWAYSDYEQLMTFTEKMLAAVLDAVHADGSTTCTWRGHEIDLQAPWPRLSVRQSLLEIGGLDPTAVDDEAALTAELTRLGEDLPKHPSTATC